MNAESISRYRDDFMRLEAQLAGAALPSVQHARRAALDRFIASGFPTIAQEDWKYTNVASLAKRAFKSMPGSPDGVSERLVERFALDDAYLLVYVNGRYAPSLSHVTGLPPGVQVHSLVAALDDSDDLQALLADDDATTENGFAALNAALWMDGAYIDLAPGAALDRAVHLLFISTEAELATHPRNIIHAGAGARAAVIEHYAGTGDNAYFTNARTQIVLDDGAVIEHYKLQQEGGRAFHIADIDARQGADSRFTSHSVALGALLSRNDINTRFDAQGCRATLNGLYMATGRMHVDHHTCIDHAQPRGISRENYKGVLDGAARAVFNGKVIVRPDAQKSDAYQSNRNLLLSEGAEIDTKPQLEIYADDVKCSHGATVGQLDESQLFYLRSRGVDAAAARQLLVHAFAAEIIDQIAIPALRDRLEQVVNDSLARRLSGSGNEYGQ
ncbi:MAG: Fe-S cluster assembly protein SufD [Noviherbaspirillum sp.]